MLELGWKATCVKPSRLLVATETARRAFRRGLRNELGKNLSSETCGSTCPMCACQRLRSYAESTARLNLDQLWSEHLLRLLVLHPSLHRILSERKHAPTCEVQARASVVRHCKPTLVAAKHSHRKEGHQGLGKRGTFGFLNMGWEEEYCGSKGNHRSKLATIQKF
jgi:hypothetical protein